jgi:hypothetical protein
MAAETLGIERMVRPLLLSDRAPPNVASMTLPLVTVKEKGPIGVLIVLVSNSLRSDSRNEGFNARSAH